MSYEIRTKDYELTEGEQEKAAFLLEGSRGSLEAYNSGEEHSKMTGEAYYQFKRELYDALAIRLALWPLPPGTLLSDGKTVRFWRVEKIDVPTG